MGKREIGGEVGKKFGFQVLLREVSSSNLYCKYQPGMFFKLLNRVIKKSCIWNFPVTKRVDETRPAGMEERVHRMC